MPPRKEQAEEKALGPATVRELDELTIDLTDEQFRTMLANIALWARGNDDWPESRGVLSEWVEATLRQAYVDLRQNREQLLVQQKIAAGP